jgi:hypothetical protein
MKGFEAFFTIINKITARCNKTAILSNYNNIES